MAIAEESCQIHAGRDGEEHKYQQIFLFVFSGSRVTMSQVCLYTKIEL